VIDQLPASLRQLLQFERFNLFKPERFYDPDSAPFDPGYLPQNCEAFALPCFWVPRDRLYVYGSQASVPDDLKMFERGGREARVVFPVHPASQECYSAFLAECGAEDCASTGLRIWALPTSSVRTLLAWPDGAPEQAVFVKTSLHSQTFGDRILIRRKVAASIGMSSLVHESRAQLPSSFRYLPEFTGFVPRHAIDAGVVIRSIPQEIKNGSVLVAPLFAFAGGSERSTPLLLTMQQRHGLRPEDILEEVLCAHFARLWLQMALGHGLMLEAHGQDLLLQLSPELKPIKRFYYRDFEGLQVDWQLRRVLSRSTPRYMPHESRWHETYAAWGYPLSQLTWFKVYISLFDYLNFVLNDIELAFEEWQRLGLIKGRDLAKGEATLLFSRHLFEAIEERYGIRSPEVYNIFSHLNRFLVFFMRVREEVMRAALAGCSASSAEDLAVSRRDARKVRGGQTTT
jgi:ferric iron reductase FhuF-like transporter/IucA/IucC family protein